MPFIITTTDEPTKNIYKTIMFYYDVKNTIVYAQPHYLDAKGRLYWPLVTFNPHDVDAIYEYSISCFQKMNGGAGDENCGCVDLASLMHVKTFAGAVRKLEFYSFEWTDWQGFHFCKGERNVGGYSMFIETMMGNEITLELFRKAYNTRLKKLERKLERKELKKLKQQSETV